MLSGLEENMIACPSIANGAYIAGNVTSSAYPAGYGRAQDYPHVSTMKTAVRFLAAGPTVLHTERASEL